MSERFTVLIADFLDETSIESAVLGDIAEFVMAGATDESQLAPHSTRADAIMLFHDLTMLGEATFSRAARCRGLVRAGVGYNNVDLEAATRHGVVVCNVPDYGTEEVADHAIMFLLALVRRLVPSHQAIRAGTWDHRTAVGAPRLRGKTFGIVGCGRIGTATALRAKALGLDVVFYDPYLRQGMDKALGIRRVHRLEELLEQSHFVSLHCYLDAASHHLIDARTIAGCARCDPDQHGAGPARRGNRAARGPRVGTARRRRARCRRARAARRRAPARAPERPVHAAHGVLQRRGLRRAAHQDRRGGPPPALGRAAAEPGECRGRAGVGGLLARCGTGRVPPCARYCRGRTLMVESPMLTTERDLHDAARDAVPVTDPPPPSRVGWLSCS